MESDSYPLIVNDAVVAYTDRNQSTGEMSYG
jgi:hypothetical protein